MQQQPVDIDEQQAAPRPVFSVLFAGQLLQPFRRYPHDTIVEPSIVAVYILSSIFILDKIENQGNYLYGDQYYQDWSYIDCTYFIAQTMSTVGYGDLAPTPAHGSRAFAGFETCFSQFSANGLRCDFQFCDDLSDFDCGVLLRSSWASP